MKPAENIEKLIRNIEIDTNAKTDEAVLNNVLEAFEKSEGTKSAAIQQNIWRIIIKSTVTKIATAAVIIFTIGLIFIYQEPREQLETVRISEVTKPPVEMMTAVSLTIAYCNEGIEAVEKQYKKAYEMLGPRKTDVSIQELLVEFNGEESKGTKL